MNHVLYVDKAKENVAMDLGTLVHRLFETEISKPVLTDAAFDEALQGLLAKRPLYTARERYLLSHHVKTLKMMFMAIKKQHEKTSYHLYKREEKVTVDYDKATLVGVVDKVMALNDESRKKVFLVDYKTGAETLVLPRLLYGLNVQLLFYVLLVNATYESAVDITGFFEQTVIPKVAKLKSDKVQDEVIEEHSLLKGYTIADYKDIELLDQGVSEASFIKGHKINKDGRLNAKAKTYQKEELTLWLSHLESMIEMAITTIFKGSFTIDPKRIKNNEVSCEYCAFKDICYRQESDFIDLDLPKDQEALRHEIKQRGEQ